MKYFIHIDDIFKADKKLIGDKAFNIALLKKSGAKVPLSSSLTTAAYKKYLRDSGMDTFIMRELKRKSMSDYRWEELWDISLRIKNNFIRREMPPDIRDEVCICIRDFFHGKALAVRSSAPGEDGRKSSFAGLHESYINLSATEEILKHIRLVWASLWSVSALLYRRELELDPFKSAMSVLIQEVVGGECSGVAFSISPDQPECIAVEAVYGLNQGLVDGTVEPDHWSIERRTMRIRDFFPASEHKKIVKPVKNNVILSELPNGDELPPPLNSKQVLILAGEAMRQEKHFGHARDLEWTFASGKMLILQSRPITNITENTDSRQYYNNLLPSLEQLKKIRVKLENEVLPDMLKTGKKWKTQNLQSLDNHDLVECLAERDKEYRQYLGAYDKYCIPFAHGVRLFGEIYNSRLKPDDPYEFVELLRTKEMLSLKRNEKINTLARLLSKRQAAADKTAVLDVVEEIFACRYKSVSEIPETLVNLVKNYKGAAEPDGKDNQLERRFLNSFDAGQKEAAFELLDLARASYRLRDDDNIYLDSVKNGLKAVREETAKRLSANLFSGKLKRTAEKKLSGNIPELHSPAISGLKQSYNDKSVKFRQLTGQPAGKGIARGRARVIHKFNDLYDFQKGEVLVCDAVEPSMTIVAPLAAAVIERRGGMLIHGAIIAREYGLPCVTGVPEAAGKIKNGDMLSVDGWLGIVTIL